MAFKPNYNQQRSERNRAKEQKKQLKLQRREEDAAKRRASRGDRHDGGAAKIPKAPRESRDPSISLEQAHGPQETSCRHRLRAVRRHL